MKIASTKYEVDELIKSRWSARAYSDNKIPKEILFSLFEAASWAASSRNEQPWRFIYGLKGEGENYEKILDTMVMWNQKWAKKAPVLMMGVASLNSNYHNKPNFYAHYDLGQAVANMALQGASKGVYVHQVGGFYKAYARERFNIPVDFEPVVVIAAGYLGEPDDLRKDLRELELMERNRNDLSKFIFDGEFKP